MNQIFRMRIDEKGIGVVTFSVPGEPRNLWTKAALRGFARLIEELDVAKGVRGILFLSGKPDHFIVGPNPERIRSLENAEAMGEILDLFRGAFDPLEHLGCPTVAAIHGPCLGSGLEFALACTARIAKEGKETLLGLPECTIGLLPGGGGTQRLPRLIGPRAVDLILKGTPLTASEALAAGLIDRLVPEEGDLSAAARDLLESLIAGATDLPRNVHDVWAIDAAVDAARANLIRDGGEEGSVGSLLALEAIQKGLRGSLEEGLEIEKGQCLDMVQARLRRGV